MNKSKTIGELLDEARQKSGAPKLAGHDIMDLERFAPDARHMIVFDVLSHDSPIGWKGEKTRAFLTDQGYERSWENERKAGTCLSGQWVFQPLKAERADFFPPLAFRLPARFSISSGLFALFFAMRFLPPFDFWHEKRA